MTAAAQQGLSSDGLGELLTRRRGHAEMQRGCSVTLRDAFGAYPCVARLHLAGGAAFASSGDRSKSPYIEFCDPRASHNLGDDESTTFNMSLETVSALHILPVGNDDEPRLLHLACADPEDPEANADYIIEFPSQAMALMWRRGLVVLLGEVEASPVRAPRESARHQAEEEHAHASPQPQDLCHAPAREESRFAPASDHVNDTHAPAAPTTLLRPPSLDSREPTATSLPEHHNHSKLDVEESALRRLSDALSRIEALEAELAAMRERAEAAESRIAATMIQQRPETAKHSDLPQHERPSGSRGRLSREPRQFGTGGASSRPMSPHASVERDTNNSPVPHFEEVEVEVSASRSTDKSRPSAGAEAADRGVVIEPRESLHLWDPNESTRYQSRPRQSAAVEAGNTSVEMVSDEASGARPNTARFVHQAQRSRGMKSNDLMPAGMRQTTPKRVWVDPYSDDMGSAAKQVFVPADDEFAVSPEVIQKHAAMFREIHDSSDDGQRD